MQSRRHGFTIIEVLCALAIFTLAAVVLGASYVNVLNSYYTMGKVAKSDDDLRFARAMLLSEPDLKKAEEGATFTTVDGRRVIWTCKIEPTTIANLFTVNYHCEISGNVGEAAVVSETVFRVLRPTWSEAAERDKLQADAQKRILEIQEKKR